MFGPEDVLTESAGTEILGDIAAGNAGVDGAVALLHVVSLSATLLLSSPNPGGIAGPVSSNDCACANESDVKAELTAMGNTFALSETEMGMVVEVGSGELGLMPRDAGSRSTAW